MEEILIKKIINDVEQLINWFEEAAFLRRGVLAAIYIWSQFIGGLLFSIELISIAIN